jgi:hypothetical protein
MKKAHVEIVEVAGIFLNCQSSVCAEKSACKIIPVHGARAQNLSGQDMALKNPPDARRVYLFKG